MGKTIVAIEGLVHAGKSMLANRLAERCRGVKCVGEYVDFATSKFPDFPHNLKEAREGRNYFLNLENKRAICIGENDRFVVLDRSLLSILAYHYSVEAMTDGKTPCFAESLKCFSSESWIFPNSCIYLDVSDMEICKRHCEERSIYNPILLNPEFNAHLRRFYEEVVPVVFPSMTLSRIDASGTQEEVFLKAMFLLEK